MADVLCPFCGADSTRRCELRDELGACPQEFADEHDELDDPNEDDGWDECGMTPDGQCTLAGTEWCDWSCPRNRRPPAAEEASHG